MINETFCTNVTQFSISEKQDEHLFFSENRHESNISQLQALSLSLANTRYQGEILFKS